MIELSNLKNTSRPKKKVQRVGRGVGSKRGKTSCRGEKGDGSRQGYQRRFGYEGGQTPLYTRVPIRGFTRGKFLKPNFMVHLSMINTYFEDGETVNVETLREKGVAPRKILGKLKVLANGELTKKVNIEAHAFSEAAKEKLTAAKISFKEVE